MIGWFEAVFAKVIRKRSESSANVLVASSARSPSIRISGVFTGVAFRGDESKTFFHDEWCLASLPEFTTGHQSGNDVDNACG